METFLEILREVLKGIVREISGNRSQVPTKDKIADLSAWKVQRTV
jgi:hypothetical protein